MEEHPELFDSGSFEVVRRNGPPTAWGASEAVACTVDRCRDVGIPVAPQIKARLGKAAKGLIESGFAPDVVVSACVVAIKTGWFGSAESIAQEMVVAMAGERMGRGEYQRAIAETHHRMKRDESQVWQIMREEMTRRADRIGD